jgi:hypothetical protein
MENTLLYFFSALFQGFAAIITLGSMFYLYFIEHLNEQKAKIEEELKRQFNPQRDVQNTLIVRGIIEYCRGELPNLKKNKLL